MRDYLPDRRRSVTHGVDFQGVRFSVTVGYDGSGAAKEVFADSARGGSALAAIVDDACVVISIALQHGIAADDLGKSLGREPDPMHGGDAMRAASPIGFIVEVVNMPLDCVLKGMMEAVG